MPLNNAKADALADSFVASISGLTPAQIADAKTKFRSLFEKLYADLKNEIEIQIQALSIGTTGSAASQSGPQAPITIKPL